MTPSAIVYRVTLALSAALGWALSRRSPRYRVAAAVLTSLALVDAARLALRGSISGALDGALFMAFYSIQAAGALRILAEAPAWPAAAMWLVVSVALALGWDALPEAGIEGLYTGAFALSLAAQLGAGVAYFRRNRVTVPSAHAMTALVLAASAIAEATGAWIAGHPIRDWPHGVLVSIATWIVIVVWEIACLIYAPRSPR